jgi:hypothetical protein
MACGMSQQTYAASRFELQNYSDSALNYFAQRGALMETRRRRVI